MSYADRRGYYEHGSSARAAESRRTLLTEPAVHSSSRMSIDDFRGRELHESTGRSTFDDYYSRAETSDRHSQASVYDTGLYKGSGSYDTDRKYAGHTDQHGSSPYHGRHEDHLSSVSYRDTQSSASSGSQSQHVLGRPEGHTHALRPPSATEGSEARSVSRGSEHYSVSYHYSHHGSSYEPSQSRPATAARHGYVESTRADRRDADWDDPPRNRDADYEDWHSQVARSPGHLPAPESRHQGIAAGNHGHSGSDYVQENMKQRSWGETGWETTSHGASSRRDNREAHAQFDRSVLLPAPDRSSQDRNGIAARRHSHDRNTDHYQASGGVSRRDPSYAQSHRDSHGTRTHCSGPSAQTDWQTRAERPSHQQSQDSKPAAAGSDTDQSAGSGTDTKPKGDGAQQSNANGNGEVATAESLEANLDDSSMVIENDWAPDETNLIVQEEPDEPGDTSKETAASRKKRKHAETEDPEAKLEEQRRHAKAATDAGIFCKQHYKCKLSHFCSPCCQYICTRCIEEGHETDDEAHETVPVIDICHERKTRLQAQYAYLQQNLYGPLELCRDQIQNTVQQLQTNAQQARTDVVQFIRQQVHRVESELLAQINEVERTRYKSLYDQRVSVEAQLKQLQPIVRFAGSVLSDDTSPDPQAIAHLAEAEEHLCCVEFPSSTPEPCVSSALHYIPKEYGYLEQMKSFGTLRTKMAQGSQCIVQGIGLTEAFRGNRMTVILSAFDRNGERILNGGDKLECFWSDVPHDKAALDPPEITSVDNHDGTYDISYRFASQKCGLYTMRVCMNGEDVYGSPFRINRGHWHLLATSDPANGTKLSDGHLKATARSNHQFIIGNRGFLQGQHTWKVTFEGGRFAVGVIGFVDPKDNEPWEEILRRSWSWAADGKTYHGPHQEPTTAAQHLDYAKEVYVHLDCSTHTLTLSRQLLDDKAGSDVKVDCIQELPAGEPLFPLFALRSGGTKFAVDLH